MDNISILFVSIIVFLGGLTAYIADFLGRYMGKKKLSLLGIRPKYVAISFAIFAGLLIPLITIISLYYSSTDVRVWLEEGQQAAIQRDHKIQELDYMISKIADRTAEVKKLEIQQLEAKNKLIQAQERVSQAQIQTKKIRGNLKKIKLELQSTKAHYKNLQKNFELAQINSINLNSKNQDLLKLKNELLNDLHNKTEQTKEISLHLLKLQKHVDDLNEQKKIIKQQFDETSNQLRKEIQNTQTQLMLAHNERDTLLQETDQIKKGLDLNIYNTRFHSILFKQGEELASITIPARASLLDVMNLIDKLIDISELKVQQKNTKLEHALSKKQFQDLYNTLTSKFVSSRVTLSISWNTFEGETVPYNILVCD